MRVAVVVRRFGGRGMHEASLLELPPGRAPPQGALVSAVVTVEQPRGPDHGFDERTWLRRKGVHVVLRADRWRTAGARRGLGAVADRLRARVEAALLRGASGEREAVLAGVVLGDDQAVPERLRDRFRASGLYHLLAVSGQNVALVAVGALFLARLVGVPRVLGKVGALAGIGAYVLAVGAQPSVIRAGVVGALGSLAWIAARQRDRWHFLLLAAFVLLAWNPYTLLDAGFQLSFAAVAAIFVFVRPLLRVLEGYPLPRWLAEAIAVSTACAAATAPVLWLQFHSVPLLAVPANALAAPGDATAARARVARGARRSLRSRCCGAAREPRRVVRRLAGALRAARRRPAVRPGQLESRRPRARRLRSGCRGLCLAAMAELKPVYLISGSDRPKIRLALERLRNRFEEGAVEVLAAAEHPAEDAVAACNALGLFGGGDRLVIVEDVEAWKAADAKAIAEYLKNSAPETVLALVASEMKKDSALAKACAKAGELLVYEAPKKRDLPSWVAKQFEQHGTTADRDACRLLVVMVGEDPEQLRSEIEKLATWSGGEPVSEADVRLLASLSAETSVFVLTDAWGRRDAAAALASVESLLERSGRA